MYTEITTKSSPYVVGSLQEIYPPKVTEFAYVTDGACNAASILDTELIICKVREEFMGLVMGGMKNVCRLGRGILCVG